MESVDEEDESGGGMREGGGGGTAGSRGSARRPSTGILSSRSLPTSAWGFLEQDSVGGSAAQAVPVTAWYHSPGLPGDPPVGSLSHRTSMLGMLTKMAAEGGGPSSGHDDVLILEGVPPSEADRRETGRPRREGGGGSEGLLPRHNSLPALRRVSSTGMSRTSTDPHSGAHLPSHVVFSRDSVQVMSRDTALIYSRIPNVEGEEPVLQLEAVRLNRGEMLRHLLEGSMVSAEVGSKKLVQRCLDCLEALPRLGALVAGPMLALGFFICFSGTVEAQQMAVAGVLLWMAMWWLLEVVPVAVTALIPALMWPILGVMSAEAVASCYCNDAMSLIFGTFIMSVAVQRWGLDKRLAIMTVTNVGPRPRLLLLATLGLTTFLGCLMSNTATATMMMPLVVAMVSVPDEEEGHCPPNAASLSPRGSTSPFPGEGAGALQPLLPQEGTGRAKAPVDSSVAKRYLKGMILGTAYTCSASGFATLTGTGPNLTFSGVWSSMSGEQIGWFQWLTFGLPLSLSLVACIFVVINLQYLRAPTSELVGAINLEGLKQDRKALPPFRGAELVVILDYTLCVVLWISRKITIGSFNGWHEYFPEVGNGTVALLCTLLLFVWPAEGVRPKQGAAAGTQGPRVMDWAAAKTIKWNTLILIAGGFALSAGVTGSGLDRLIANAFSPLEAMPNDVTMLCCIILTVFITDWLVSSNVAVATLALPILGGVAEDMGLHKLALMVPATIACSLSFCSPVATPPNAIAFSTGHLKVSEMVVTGSMMAACGVVLTWIFAKTLGAEVFGYIV